MVFVPSAVSSEVPAALPQGKSGGASVSAIQLTFADRCETGSPGKFQAHHNVGRHDVNPVPFVDRLTTEDLHEILRNARLTRWHKPLLDGTVVSLYPPVFEPGLKDERGNYLPVPVYWQRKFDKKRRGESARRTFQFRAPCWTGEPRPIGYESVELVRPDITEEMLTQFAGHWLTRNLRWTLVGNHDAGNPLTYTTTRPPAERLARGDSFMDANAVAAFLMQQPSIRKLLCFEHGEEIVTELQRVLTYGTKVEASAEKLASLGITQAAFERRVQRLRHEMEEQLELPYGKRVIEQLMDGAPEGTRDVLERARNRAGRKVGDVWRKFASSASGDPTFQNHPFESYFDRAENPVKYLGERR
jgi:hypothetical protein